MLTLMFFDYIEGAYFSKGELKIVYKMGQENNKADLVYKFAKYI